MKINTTISVTYFALQKYYFYQNIVEDYGMILKKYFTDPLTNLKK